AGEGCHGRRPVQAVRFGEQRRVAAAQRRIEPDGPPSGPKEHSYAPCDELRYFVLQAMITAFLLFPALALADEAQIRRVLEAKLNDAKIEGIQPAPMPGLFEVRFRGPGGVQVVYTDANASYIMTGKIYETLTDHDLTEERLRKLDAIRFDSLPFEQAVKVQR